MKDLNFAVEQYQWNNDLNRQNWVVVKVFVHKVDALNYINLGSERKEDAKGIYKITEVFGNIDF